MRRWIFALLCCLALTGSALAAEPDWFTESDLTGSLDAQAQALLDGVTLDAADFSGGVRQLAANSLPQGRTFLRDALRTGGQILAIVLLCALLCDLEEGRAGRAIGLAGALAMGVLGAQLLQTMGTASSGALAQLQSYTDVLLPALSMATASCGGFTAAATLQAGTVAFLALLCRLILHLLQPLALVYLALACAEAAMGDETLAKLRGLVGWIIGASLKAVLFAFTAYLAISGAISGSADATTVKAAKLTLSGVVPVVGSMLSDASETLVVSAGVLRNSIGVFGMLAVLALCAAPFLQTGLTYLVLKLTAAVAGVFDAGHLTKLADAIAGAAGYLTAMTGSCALMLLISLVSYIKVVV